MFDGEMPLLAIKILVIVIGKALAPANGITSNHNITINRRIPTQENRVGPWPNNPQLWLCRMTCFIKVVLVSFSSHPAGKWSTAVNGQSRDSDAVLGATFKVREGIQPPVSVRRNRFASSFALLFVPYLVAGDDSILRFFRWRFPLNSHALLNVLKDECIQ